MALWIILLVRTTGHLIGLRRPFAGIAVSHHARGTDVCLLCLLYVVCCQVEVSPTGPSFVQRSPTKCGVSERNLETSTTRTSRPNRDVDPYKKKNGHWIEQTKVKMK